MIGIRVGPMVGVNAGVAVGVTASDIGGGGSGVFDAIIGDSNGGTGDTDKLYDPALLLTYFQVQYSARHALALTDPPTWVQLAPGGVRPYAPGGGSGMGIELTFARTLFEGGGDTMLATDWIAGTTLADWLPSAVTPAINLWTLWIQRMLALQTATGRRLRSVTVSLGTNDATNAGLAAAFAANMTTILAAIRAAFPGIKICWIKTNGNGSQANLATVRTAQTTVKSGDAALILVDCDRTGVPDGFHYDADGYAVIGVQCAFQLLDAFGFARRVVTTTPAVVGWGPAAHSAGALSPVAWPGSLNGDLEVLYVVTGLANTAITTPAGWTLVTNTDQTSTQGGTNKQHGTVYTRPVVVGADGLAAVTTVVDTNNFNAAQSFTVRGPNANPTVDVASGAVNDGFDTGPTVITGVTTTAANELVLVFVGGYSGGANDQAVTNTGLTGVTELQDQPYIIGSDRQVISLTVGVKSAAGATGASSATSTANRILVAATVGIKP